MTTEAQQTTLGGLLGEIVWLMSQSSLHKKLTIGDLEWLVMPPLLLKQFKLYHDDQKPMGLVFWAYLNQEAEQRFLEHGKPNPEDWGNNVSINLEQGMQAEPGGNCWVVELLTPFHNSENKHREFILSDLMNTLPGQTIRFVHINMDSLKPEVITLGASQQEPDTH